ncbi:MAG: protein adenylyltransferase SelO family protein [Synechococcus sp.]
MDAASRRAVASTTTFHAFSEQVNYSLLEALRPDPEATSDGNDHRPRPVASGHWVPVTPTPLPDPSYVAHSSGLFAELGLDDRLAHDDDFRRLFSGDSSIATPPMRPWGWATGYALSIYGTEYTQQCPFGTGNGYGDGRAMSIVEGVFNGKRWEMQLKGGGPTPYCRGADGRAVLRSSVREFLAQEFMHALGVPTSRSLTLYVSQTERVRRPWYSDASRSYEPDVMVDNPAAISTRVAPSFLRVGQIELFARRVRAKAHSDARLELELIVRHLIDRNYRDDIDPALPFNAQVVELARLFRARLTALVANWMRVGYCQGNFNSDNCAAGGFTLDYGPFGFCELFDPRFQPWTGGGQHFCFFNQANAADANYRMFWSALRELLSDDTAATAQLDQLREEFPAVMQQELEQMWASKLGLAASDDSLVQELLKLMATTRADYSKTFRMLCEIPDTVEAVTPAFYLPINAELEQQWNAWLQRWRQRLSDDGTLATASAAMKQVNPAITWREWLVAPAYEQAAAGNNQLVLDLQAVFSDPYSDPSAKVASRYDQLRPRDAFNAGGISHYSCSS